MPREEFHKKHYDELIREYPGFKYDFEIFSSAIDQRFPHHKIEKERVNKTMKHRNFRSFVDAYYKWQRAARKHNTTTIESLKYLWVNHLVVDFVYNKDHGVFADEKNKRYLGWKIIAKLGHKYVVYGLNLAKKLGLNSKNLKIIKSKIDVSKISWSSRVAERCFIRSGPHYDHRMIGIKREEKK